MNMTETERIELCKYLAIGLMEYELICSPDCDKYPLPYVRDKEGNEFNFRPDKKDSPASQLLGVIEAMRERGWFLYVEPEPNYTFPKMPGYETHEIIYEIGFYRPDNKEKRGYGMFGNITADAACQAARMALGSVKADSDNPGKPGEGEG